MRRNVPQYTASHRRKCELYMHYFILYRRKIVNRPLTGTAVYCIRQSPWKTADVNNTNFVSRNLVSGT